MIGRPYIRAGRVLRLYRNWVLSTSRLARTPEESMADDKSKPGGQDRTRININEDYELRDWSKKFGVSPEELKKAVAKVGNNAADVRNHLAR